MAPYGRRLKQAGGVGIDVSVNDKVAVECPDAREDARHAPRRNAHFGEGRGETVNVVEPYGQRVEVLAAEISEVFPEIVPVGLTGIWRQAHLHYEVGAVAGNNVAFQKRFHGVSFPSVGVSCRSVLK